MLIVSDSEEEDYDTAVRSKASQNDDKVLKKQSLCLDGGSDDDDDDASIDSDGYLSPLDCNKENEHPMDNRNSKRRNHPDSIKKDIPNDKLEKKTPNPKPKKMRRRSSARFLRLSGRFGDEGAEVTDEVPEEEQREKLNELYSKAIQLNAANKINAVNSWGLNIIDKMDKFLGDDEDDILAVTSPNLLESGEPDKIGNEIKEKRVNFTKASCTIDACVKIYSYRVDDAHLTSYKVLANLNRTDTGKGNDKLEVNMENDPLENEETTHTQRTHTKTNESAAAVKVIETNQGESTHL
jgi:condensin complex subunit 2